ncbi:MAG: hypothetical protein ACRESS_08280 [Stenotrophobium sp.]
MFDLLVFVAGVTLAPLSAAQKAVPSPDLLEFVADWPEAEAQRFIDVRKNVELPLPGLNPRGKTAGTELSHEH